MRRTSGMWMSVALTGLAVAALASGCSTTKVSNVQTASVQHVAPPKAAHAAPAAPSLSPQDAWQRLMAGNARFVEGRPEHPNQSYARRVEVAKGQHPFAVVLTCSDSRVPPEVLFDTGLGDIFVIRVAGNTADDAAIASMEYAVEHLHVPLVVVLGHERCGAVQAAIQAAGSNEKAPGHLAAILDPIAPAVVAAGGQAGDAVERVVQANVRRVAEQVRTSKPVLAGAVHHHHLRVIAAGYDLDTGRVTALDGAQAAH